VTFEGTASITLTNTILAQNTDNGTAPDLYQRTSAPVTLTNSLVGTIRETTSPPLRSEYRILPTAA